VGKRPDTKQSYDNRSRQSQRSSNIQSQFNIMVDRLDQNDQDFTRQVRDPDIQKQLYGLYMQANIGDINIKKPGLLDFKGKSKYDAWSQYQGVSPQEAMSMFVDLA